MLPVILAIIMLISLLIMVSVCWFKSPLMHLIWQIAAGVALISTILFGVFA